MDATALGGILLAGGLGLFMYTYVAYPLLLALCARIRGKRPNWPAPMEWPIVSFSLPVFNEERQIRGALASLLALDYPEDRRQVVVVSDASTDNTDAIVAEYASAGVQLLRVPTRLGKTNAEAAATPYLRGEIVVNTDASIRMLPGTLKALVAPFCDFSVGVASTRDISISASSAEANHVEGGYVGYEMLIRRLETSCGGIVGASGSGYAIRAELHRQSLPVHLSRDFASALIAREHGLRAVSVDEAVCLVPRTPSLQAEYRRKVRTIARGMETLWHERHLLNPIQFGSFAWKLWSHKVCRWLTPWALAPAALGLITLATEHAWALAVSAVGALVAILGVLVVALRGRHKVPPVLAVIGSALAANGAVLHATVKGLRGDRSPTWEPTRRELRIGEP